MRTETRVYVLKPFHYNKLDVGAEELTDEEFMEEAENAGLVYTLPNFQETFNESLIDSEEDFIRIIDVETISIDIETMGLDGKSKIYVEQHNLDKIGEEAFEALRRLNPKGGIKAFVKLATNFGYLRAKEDLTPKPDPDNEPVPMKEIYRIMHKRMKTSDNSDEIFDILQEIKFPEDYK